MTIVTNEINKPTQTKIIVFGSNKSKQLIVDQEFIRQPEVVHIESDCIRSVSCGVLHTVFCLCNGTLLISGDNSQMQFGKKDPKSHFEKITAMKDDKYVFVASGQYFSAALTQKGSIYTWGNNKLKQLGRDINKDNGKVEIVSSLSSNRIVQIACGSGHCIALSIESILFAWGDNSFGQLGLGNIGSSSSSLPKIINSLECLPIKQIACGEFHSIILTTSGSIYTWGSNTYGQLGTGKNGIEEPKSSIPIYLKSIKGIHVVYICSGNNHNAFLTVDGGAFTFGDGRYGQLGHGNFESQCSPLKVIDLMGSTVSQISCGDHFTIVFVRDYNRFYGFGKSDEGQLGMGNLNENINTPLKLDDFLSDSILKSNLKNKRKSLPSEKLILRRIYSGGGRSIVLLTDDTFPNTDDLRAGSYSDSSFISMINDNVISEMQKPLDEIKDEYISTIYTVMGSLGCLSASFLDKKDKNSHYAMIKTKHGVDIEASYLFQKQILEKFNPSELEMLKIHMYENLIQLQKYQQNYPGIECLRSFLILLVSPLLDNVNWYDTITIPVFIAVNSFSVVPQNYMESWLSKLKPRHFKRVVETITNVIKHHISQIGPKPQNWISDKSQIQLAASLDLLKILYTINERDKLISYNFFYIPTLNDKLDIEKSFVDWATANTHGLPKSFSFCSYPFIFDAKAKSKLLQVEASLFMRNAVLEMHTNLIMSILNAQETGIVSVETPFFEIGVNRETVLQDSIKVLEKASQKEFKKPLKISFSNEEALDDGGVVKEYFLLVIREIMLPKTGLFKCFSQSKICYFQQSVKDKNNIYKCVGQLCGLAIYNGVIVDLHFPLLVFKKLLGESACLDDLFELDPVLGNSLQQILDYNESDFSEVFDLYHEINWEDALSKPHRHELMTDGHSCPVTNDNKEQYVLDYIQFILNDNISSGFDAFKSGFYLVCVGSVLRLFRPSELQELIVGSEITDWLELQNNALYEGEYWKGHQVIKWFWEVFTELNYENKKCFLRFLTGCDRAPITGMMDFKIIIQSTNGGDDYFPVAHTCYNLLDLPKYSKKKILKQKLLVAIRHTEGFTLV